MSDYKIRFVKALGTLAESLDYKPENAQRQAEIYYTAIIESSKTPIQDFEDACKKLILTYDTNYGKKFPKIPEILQAVGRSPEQMSGKSYLRASKVASRIGYNHSISFGDDRASKAIMSTIQDLGGWSKWCQNYWNEKTKEEFKKIWTDKYFSRSFDAPKYLKSPIGGKKNVVTLKPNQLMIGE